MSPERRLEILGAACVAEINLFVSQATPPSPELVEEIRQIFAPAVQRIALREAAKRRAPSRHRTAA